MLIRHIRPGSIEWQEAVASEDFGKLMLSPEEQTRLKTLVEVERESGPVDASALAWSSRRPMSLGGGQRQLMRA